MLIHIRVMSMTELSDFVLKAINLLTTLFVFAVGIGVLLVLIMYIVDRTQSQKAILRNYPVVGRFRGLFEHLGVFFRQYFFAMDREELPFNRAQRSWAYRAAKNINNTAAFGSTKDLRPEGTVLFVNCPFPELEEDTHPAVALTFGPDCVHPYTTANYFNISAMSFGALSRPAVQALSRGAAKAGIWLNTGEGGLSPWHLEGGCDLIFQIGTAKYGVRDEAGRLVDDKLREIAAQPQVKMIELKLAQGAKPGKGGMLPGVKVTAEIAKIRGIPEGEASISPNRHPEINNNEELLDMLVHIRQVTGLPVGFKTVISNPVWLENLFSLIKQRGLDSAPDFITVDSGDGGTGASPMPLMDDVGVLLKESLPILVDKLNEAGLRERIKVICSGKRVTPSDVAWALCMGADFINNARGFMFSLGCIQALQCNKNTCPTGITTHDHKLQKGLVPESKVDRVADYAENMMYEVEMIAHACGVKGPRELRRKHARIVVQNGLSIPMNELFPDK